MNRYLAGRILSAILVNPFLLLVVKRKRYWTIFWCVLLIPLLFFSLLFWHNWHYSERGFRQLYYLVTYDPNEIRVVEDDNFLFYEEEYSREYTLDSEYYIAHRILLIPETKLIPVSYEFNGKIRIDIFDETGQLLNSFDVERPDKILREGSEDYFDNYLMYVGYYSSRATSVFAFELGLIPFDLLRDHKDRLKNMKIKVTVLKPDKKMLEYCDKATLTVIPDLRELKSTN